jgi:hypothetical protein
MNANVDQATRLIIRLQQSQLLKKPPLTVSSSLPKHVDASGSWEQAICCRKPFAAATSQRNTL